MFYFEKSYYLLCGKRFYGFEILDFAGDGNNPIILLNLIKKALYDHAYRLCHTVARDATSYRLLLYLTKAKIIKILRNRSCAFCGEQAHDIIFLQ